jgi:hypothetical protein
MEDQDRETRIDEDVEGHSHHAPNVRAPHKGREDEGDDVEAHSHHPAPHKGREDEGDDVEGHVFKQAPHKAAPHKG